MSLPVYKAIEFKKIMKGGASKPWLVQVLVEGSPVTYVVKLYSQQSVDNYTLAKEIISWVLAKEFDLNLPQAALIEFSRDFINILNSEMQQELSLKDPRIKFGTEQIEGFTDFNSELSTSKINEYDIATIFAFDILIQNQDRRIGKTSNILINKDDYYLIDHEFTFYNPEAMLESFQKKAFMNYTGKNHVFYKTLRNKKSKESLFETFEEYLRLVGCRSFNSYSNQLNSYGHPIEIIDLIEDYITFVVTNHTHFRQLLLQTII